MENLIDKLLGIVRELNFDEFREGNITIDNSADSLLIELEYYKKKHLQNKNKIDQIIIGVTNFSAGEFAEDLPISDDEDELDVICMALNTFKDELLATTVSSDYFNNIYNTVSEMIFVLDTSLVVKDVNKALLENYFFNKSKVIGNSIQSFLSGDFINELNRKVEHSSILEIKKEGYLKTAVGTSIPVDCTITKMLDKHNVHVGYIVLAKNITQRLKEEQILFNVIMQTQEDERQRLAYDLHDSLGQELNAIKMQLSAVKLLADSQPEKSIELLDSTMNMLDETVQNVRKISYNLMPAALERGSLSDAIHELTSNLERYNQIEFIINVKLENIVLEEQFKKSIYRIVQEFINNSIKHAKANSITVNIYTKERDIFIELSDNGIGFDPDKIKLGSGLRSIRSRVKALKGILEIDSKIDKGTRFKAIIKDYGND